MEVMLDVHAWWKIRSGYDRGAVEDLITSAVRRDCHWVEEPVSPGNHADYIDLAATGAPLAGGESKPTPNELVMLGETGAVAFLQGDVRRHYGYTSCHPAVESCVGCNVEFIPHDFRTWAGLLANAHLVAAAPEVSLPEYPVSENDPPLDTETDPGMCSFDLAFDIIEGQPAAEDGVLSLSDESGLGTEVNFDALDDYPFRDEPWTGFHYDED